ncbi:MAG: ATP-binding cassette domain-containing protein, partial [Sphingobium sp.]
MVTIAAEGLSVRLGRHPAVTGIDLKLTSGQLVGVIGPNGAGKSTLIRGLLGLVRPA